MFVFVSSAGAESGEFPRGVTRHARHLLGFPAGMTFTDQCLLRWRRCHAVTEVEKVLPAIKLNKYYIYKKRPPPAPASGGHAALIKVVRLEEFLWTRN